MIVKIHGGMGNQMFQYAYGITEAMQRNEPLYLDLSGLKLGDTPHGRRYSLGAWVDASFTHDDTEGTVHVGYWQNENYFSCPLIRELFSMPRGKTSYETAVMAEKIISQDSVFIGVRRQDYLWPERANYHGVLPMSYYEEALSLFPRDMPVFIFTDDPEWCRKNLQGTVVDVNAPDEKHWDIWLMSLCKHAIIANSTFHFWGAWLGPDSRGTVVAPKQWFAGPENTWPFESPVPKRWTTL